MKGLCDVLGIERPIVYGGSFGGFVAQSYAIRHPEHPAKLILTSTAARIDFPTIFDAFERIGGRHAREVAEAHWMKPTVESRIKYFEVCLPLYRTRPAADRDTLKRVLPSPNGSRISVAAAGTPGRVAVLAGCLRNAAAVAAAARAMAKGKAIGVIPAGERWPDGTLRPAIEDFLGAGAIVDHLDYPCSPEAQVARDAYRAAGNELASLVRLSRSGRELVDRGFSGDVDMAVEHDVSTTVPILSDGAYRAA